MRARLGNNRYSLSLLGIVTSQINRNLSNSLQQCVAFPLREGAERSEAKEGTQLPIYHPDYLISVQYPLSLQCAHWRTFPQGESFGCSRTRSSNSSLSNS